MLPDSLNPPKALFVALFVAAVTLGALPAQAAGKAEPVEVAQAGNTMSMNFIVQKLTGQKADLRKIPFVGDQIIDPLFKQLNKLPFKNSGKFGKYLEFKQGNFAVTVFNIGNYAGAPRLVMGITYNGILSTRGVRNLPGIWDMLPGIELKYPTFIYRFATGAGSVATPVVPGSQLKNLPGQLGVVADKAAKITRTLRIPVGTLVLASWEPKGVLKTRMELLNLPTGTVYLMAGADVDSFPPGGTKIGKGNVDPQVESWRNGRSFARDDKEKGEDFVKMKRMVPSASGYLKISVPGRWYNPLTAFDRTAYAQDAVLMFTYTGDVASWGTIRNLWGKNEYIYAIDIPGVLSAEKMKKLKLPDVAFALSTDQFTLADSVNAKIGMMTQFTSKTEFLRKLSVMAGATGTSQGAAAQKLLGQPLAKLDALRDAIYAATNSLPLSEIKITNPAYVPYNTAKSEYPPFDSFNVYFAASDGITATGDRGPIFVTNGTFFMFGHELASAKAKITPKSGLALEVNSSDDIYLGKVLGAELRIKGSDLTKVVANQSHVLMQKRTDWNILGIAKGLAILDFKLDNSGPRMRVKFDPTSGCAPPVPIKIDTTIAMPRNFNDFKNEIVDLMKYVKFESSGITKCADKLYEWTKDGIKYLSDGGKYVGGKIKELGEEGVKYMGEYGQKGLDETAKFGRQAGGIIGGGVVKGGKVVFDWGKNVGKKIENFGKDIGCALGLGGCRGRKRLNRVASPFACGYGHFFSPQFGKCWSHAGSALAYSGAKTKGELCLDATSGRKGSPLALRPCDGTLSQLFRTANVDPTKKMTFQRKFGKVTRECVTAAKFQKGQRIVSGNCGGALSLGHDDKGRLTAKKGNKKLCIRPDDPGTRPNRFGRMDTWVMTGGNARDIAVAPDGRVFAAGLDGKAHEFKVAQKKWGLGLSGSGLARLDVANGGVIWGITTSHALWRFQAGKWQRVGNVAANDVGVGGPKGQTVAIVGRDGENKAKGFKVYVLKPGAKSWTFLNGVAERLDVDGAGRVWIVQRNGRVWHTYPKGWKLLPTVPGGAADIGVSPTGIAMVTNKANQAYAYDGKKWTLLPGRASAISVGPDAAPWVVADAGTGPAVFTFPGAKQLGNWKGQKQPSPLDAAPLDLGGKPLILDDCEQRPVLASWSPIQPTDMTDHAANAGLTHSFQIMRNHNGERPVAIDNMDAKKDGDLVDAHKKEFRARQEFSAVFKNANQFLLYNHNVGMCLTHQRGKPSAALHGCNFLSDQLWTRKEITNKGSDGVKHRYVITNVETGKCLGGKGNGILHRGGYEIFKEGQNVPMRGAHEAWCKPAQVHVYNAWFLPGLPEGGTHSRHNEQDQVYLGVPFFDPYQYRDRYPDLKRNYAKNFAGLEDHWLASGIFEGRLGSNEFSVAAYVFRHPDLERAIVKPQLAFSGPATLGQRVGLSKDFYQFAGMRHYHEHGRKEAAQGKRKIAPITCPASGGHPAFAKSALDPCWYKNHHADLKHMSLDQAAKHWVEHGIYEGRQSNVNFSIKGYLFRHADLVNAFKGDFAKAWEHWRTRGYKEKGRNTNPLP